MTHYYGVFANGEIKFVECKLQYEQLSLRQKKCILKLLEMGLKVEVHKIVDKRTKLREVDVNFEDFTEKILEKQMTVA